MSMNANTKTPATYTVRLHKRTDRYFLFTVEADGSLKLATNRRFWSDMDAVEYLHDRDMSAEADTINLYDSNLPVPAGFKLPKKK